MNSRQKIVYHLSQGDPFIQLAVIGQIRNIKTELPDCEIEVVCHARGIDMLVTPSSEVAPHVAELQHQRVKFVVCKNTLAREKISTKDLLPDVETVSSALVEIVLKQDAGWSYIKGGL